MGITSQEALEALLSTISDKEFLQFSKEYIKTHPQMFKELESRYGAKQTKQPVPFDFKKEVTKCYTHVMKRVRWERDWSHQPDYLDWDEVGTALRKVIKSAEVQIEYGHPQVAAETALLIINSDLIQFEEEFLSEREDWDIEDLCIEECYSLIAKAFQSTEMTAKQKLDICDRLEAYTGTEVFEYCNFDVTELIEETREALLTDDEQFAILKRNLEKEHSGWRKDNLACDIWDFLMVRERTDEAIEFVRRHPELKDLRDNYVDYLMSQGRFKDAVTVLDEAIKLAKKQDQSGLIYIWRKRKLEVLEQTDDRQAIITVCRELFNDARYDDVLTYYHKLKALFTPDKWPEYRDDLLKDYDYYQNADSPLSAIYAEEKMIPQLYKILISSHTNLVPALQHYIKLFDAALQQSLVARLEPEFICGLGFNTTRKSYKELAARIKTLAGICPAAHELAVKAINHYITTYTNRPALQEELKNVKI